MEGMKQHRRILFGSARVATLDSDDEEIAVKMIDEYIQATKSKLQQFWGVRDKVKEIESLRDYWKKHVTMWTKLLDEFDEVDEKRNAMFAEIIERTNH